MLLRIFWREQTHERGETNLEGYHRSPSGEAEAPVGERTVGVARSGQVPGLFF